MKSCFIDTSIGLLNSQNNNEFIEFSDNSEKINKKVDNLFMRKIKNLLRINYVSNKIHII
jgi:hypothetical protein